MGTGFGGLTADTKLGCVCKGYNQSMIMPRLTIAR
jgi:hypothetical protein